MQYQTRAARQMTMTYKWSSRRNFCGTQLTSRPFVVSQLDGNLSIDVRREMAMLCGVTDIRRNRFAATLQDEIPS